MPGDDQISSPCNCEHGEHFDNGPGHDYLAAPAGSRHARYVGAVCDDCAAGHMAGYLEPDDTDTAAGR